MREWFYELHQEESKKKKTAEFRNTSNVIARPTDLEEKSNAEMLNTIHGVRFASPGPRTKSLSVAYYLLHRGALDVGRVESLHISPPLRRGLVGQL